MKVFRDSVRKIDIRHADKYKLSVWNTIIPYGRSVLCFNSLSGSLVMMSDDEYQPVSSVEEKLKLGVIVPETCDERKEWIERYTLAKKDDSFLDLTIAVSRNCQLRCVYCFEGAKVKHNITPEAVERIKSFVRSKIGSLKVLRVTWFGGEPLMHLPSICELSEFFIELCRSHGVRYISDITTNGVGLTAKTIHTLVHDCDVRRYMITIDGPKEIHDRRRIFPGGQGSFDIIWKNIIALSREDVGITIRVTIDKENVDGIRDLIDLVAENMDRNRVSMVFVRTHDFSFTPDDVRSTVFTNRQFAPVETDLILYAASKGIGEVPLPHHAPLGGCLREADIVIGTDGEVYRCLDTIGEKKWITGCISDMVKPQWYSEWLAWNPADGKCGSCRLLPLCSGGCPHNALFMDKKHGTDDQCPDWKYNYVEHIRLYVNRKLELNEYAEI